VSLFLQYECTSNEWIKETNKEREKEREKREKSVIEPSFQEILDDLGEDNAQQEHLLFLGHVSSVKLLEGFKDKLEGALGVFLCASCNIFHHQGCERERVCVSRIVSPLRKAFSTIKYFDRSSS